MIGFLSGTTIAAVLAVGTYIVMTTFSVTSIERVNNPSLNVGDLDYRYTSSH
ncbi:hypothetical protein [Palleronia pelagia]|uniref:Uncharacterized protein n=1 Tax=Palleronia pelagia TaxID=387096 RepID=A0A1H8D1X5_9RHOB|nr:hypothetical protein [Palleronia pelagia]SEN01225.1 hypothetical protein SAMN04488011_102167 [Palleronia pelagia]